jgi:hypothetical protein
VQVLDPNTALVEERGERAAFLDLDEPLTHTVRLTLSAPIGPRHP